MTHTAPVPPATSMPAALWETPQPWLPLLSLLVQLGIVGAGALWLDSADLGQSTDSWGYMFVVVVLAVVYLSWPLLLTAVCALVTYLTRSATLARRLVLVAAWVAAASGVAGILAGVGAIVMRESAADLVFGAVVLVASLVPLVPLVMAARQSRPSSRA